MVRAGCGLPLTYLEVYYGVDSLWGTYSGRMKKENGFTDAYLTVRPETATVCGTYANINKQYRYCESCARKFGWIW